MSEAPICPTCGNHAKATNTRFGVRHGCCGLHSWGNKPLVSQEVHDARQRCHAAFDPIWQNAETAYTMNEKGKDLSRAVKKVRKSMRNRAYHYLAHITGLPEADCHMSSQADLGKLALIEAAAKAATPKIVRDWWHSSQQVAA